MKARIAGLSLFAVALALPLTPAAAQLGQSAGYKFLQAIRESKNDEVIATLSKPGSTIVNTRDFNTGEGAIHIVTKRGDIAYLNYLLANQADPNLRDNKGETAMLIAAGNGRTDILEILKKAGANVNLANNSGETPLIRAVQHRDLATVRTLLAEKADPDQADVIAGMSARDYAHQDTRSPAIAKLIDETPKAAKRAVSGPRL
ncbi:ankyrin repeat domain-containing protein [Sphingomonas sp. H39-1-10]|uniref:ankyrin repeat domain-containing protein n=1 Tax=Sphingomonas TaxID=13687 RepID=UPI000889CFF5|nr:MULTISPECIES: ankyrin repeat domain-containing protein [Sphingomonas]MDF0488042.1 ankyrin repeat domain-containing protein [Sphingomonas pollutisoli]SDA33107.1 Ankyrin repeat [Sphingomonas sp. NFR15]